MQFHSMIQHLDQLRDGMHASLLGEVQDILNQIETRFERAVKSPEDVKVLGAVASRLVQPQFPPGCYERRRCRATCSRIAQPAKSKTCVNRSILPKSRLALSYLMGQSAFCVLVANAPSASLFVWTPRFPSSGGISERVWLSSWDAFRQELSPQRGLQPLSAPISACSLSFCELSWRQKFEFAFDGIVFSCPFFRLKSFLRCVRRCALGSQEETEEDSAVANAKIEVEEFTNRLARALEKPKCARH